MFAFKALREASTTFSNQTELSIVTDCRITLGLFHWLSFGGRFVCYLVICVLFGKYFV